MDLPVGHWEGQHVSLHQFINYSKGCDYEINFFFLGETIKSFIASIDSGSDWISFNWTTSVEDCRKVLTGFWLSIASTEQPGKQDSFQFISMNDCYCNLKEDQAIMFNTSKACNSWINPGIFPCSKYEIIIVPQFFNSLNGSAGPLNKTDTLPGDIIIHKH